MGIVSQVAFGFGGKVVVMTPTKTSMHHAALGAYADNNNHNSSGEIASYSVVRTPPSCSAVLVVVGGNMSSYF